MTKWTYDAEQRAGRLEMTATLTLAGIGAAKESLQQALAAAEQVICDLSAVREVDVAGLQLLCAARQGAEALDKILLWSDIPDCVTALAEQSGFGCSMPCLVGRGTPPV